MASPISTVLAVAVALLSLACLPCSSAWSLGRVTYYGAPEAVAKAYDPSRGEGSFGILAFGSCGYTNSDGSLPFPRDQPAATTDAHPDFPGSCGRCYEIRCSNTTLLNNQGKPITASVASNGQLAFEGDRFRPILEALDPTVPDTQGRRFPGNPRSDRGEFQAICYDPTEVHLIRITDSCPCTQVLKDTAPGVAAGGETRTQSWCCAAKGLQHFDISYWAFEKLVHPVSGAAMIEWRPVDCNTREELEVSPAYIDKSAIYKGGPRPGWSWFPQQSSNATLITPSEPTPSGSASTCLTMSPGGGLDFRCRIFALCSLARGSVYVQGMLHAGATAISFWIKSNAPADEPFASDYPAGTLPVLKMLLRKSETNQYCSTEPLLTQHNSTAPGATAPGGWFKITVPMSAFGCAGAGLPLDQVTQFDVQNRIGQRDPERNAIVCIGDVTIVR